MKRLLSFCSFLIAALNANAAVQHLAGPSYDPATDASIAVSSTTRADAFVGYEGGIGGLTWPFTGNVYELVVIPEPGALGALVGLAALGLGLSRRLRS